MDKLTQPKILIVDDKQANLKSLRILLEHLDAEILEAPSGNEALGLMVEHELALMLLDVDMPGMDGYEVARMAQSLDKTKGVPIIFITAAYRDDPHRLKGYESGAIDYIEKPIDDTILLSKVRLFLDLHIAHQKTLHVNEELRLEIFRRKKAETDNTELRLAKNRLKDSQKRLQMAMDAAAAGVWIWEIKTGEVFWDERMQQIFGVEPGSFNGTSEEWKACVHPDDFDAANAATLRALEHGDHYEHEYRVRGLDGGWRHVNAQAEIIQDNNGQPVKMVGQATDITKRKKAEEDALCFNKILEDSLNEIYLFDVDTLHFIQVNRGARENLGYSTKELHTLTTLDLEPEYTADLFAELVKPLKEGVKDRIRFNTVHRRKDGTQYPVEVFLQLMTIGRPLFLAIILDITERKQMELQLRQAQKMEAVGTLAGGIAHDFNNILGVVMGFTEIVLKKASPEEQIHKDLSQVLTASKRARDLVAQLLTFSRISDIKLKSVLIAPIIKETIKFLYATLPSTIEIKTNLISTNAVILIDPTQFHQILMNLCTNAAHAMQDSGGRLDVSLETLDVDQKIGESLSIKPGSFIKLGVSDTGTGIEPNLMDRLFDPFFTTKEIGEGTGLGLSVVHGVVKDCHGAIEVHSQVGEGATFSIYLPVARSREADIEEYHGPLRIRSPLHFLLVDDETVIIELGQRQLEGFGISTETFTSPQKALAGFNKNPDRFDCVISDLTMPGMTGIELIQRIHESRPGLPAILCTGKQEPLSLALLKQAGVTASLKKPVLLEDLARFLSDLFGDA